MAVTPAWQGLYEKHWQGLYIDHPVPPVAGRDPLARRMPGRMHSRGCQPPDKQWPDEGAAGDRERDRLRLGFATHWDPVPRATLSGSAWNLREAIRAIADTVDIGIDDQPVIRMALKLLHGHYRDGQFGSSWTNSRLTDAYLARELRRGARLAGAAEPLDAILMVNALTTFSQPFFIYYDSSWDALMASAESPARYARMRRLPTATMMARRDFQVGVYKSATQVFASSHWLKRCLVTQSGLAPERVQVVHPGGAARAATDGEDAARKLRARIEGPGARSWPSAGSTRYRTSTARAWTWSWMPSGSCGENTIRR